MICSCDICGECKPCLFYRCVFGDKGSIHEHDRVYVATDDDFLCPYYNARKLVFCSQGCLEKQMDFVLEKLKEARKNLNPQE